MGWSTVVFVIDHLPGLNTLVTIFGHMNHVVVAPLTEHDGHLLDVGIGLRCIQSYDVKMAMVSRFTEMRPLRVHGMNPRPDSLAEPSHGREAQVLQWIPLCVENRNPNLVPG